MPYRCRGVAWQNLCGSPRCPAISRPWLSFGQDPCRCCARSGCRAPCYPIREQMLPARAACACSNAVPRVTGCSTLRPADGRGPLDCRSGRDQLADRPPAELACANPAVAEFRNRINSTLVLHLEELEDAAILREDFSLRRPEPSRQSSILRSGCWRGCARPCWAATGRPRWSASHQPRRRQRAGDLPAAVPLPSRIRFRIRWPRY